MLSPCDFRWILSSLSSMLPSRTATRIVQQLHAVELSMIAAVLQQQYHSNMTVSACEPQSSQHGACASVGICKGSIIAIASHQGSHHFATQRNTVGKHTLAHFLS